MNEQDKSYTVLDILREKLSERNDLHLSCLTGRPGLIEKITEPNLNRPGLTLSGYYNDFAYQRIQIFGNGETAYLKHLENEKLRERTEKFLSYKIPCCIFTSGSRPPETFCEIAEQKKRAVLSTTLPSTEFNRRLMYLLEDYFAPSKVLHANLVEVHGIGIMLKGESGIGKSETALALVERGHLLIADDSVRLSCVSGRFLSGQGSKTMTHCMEIRGLGIINVAKLFGIGATREKKQVQLVVQLESWDKNKAYDRIGIDDYTETFLGIEVPKIILPVRPGRNIPVIIETAAMNERLKRQGVYTARDFNEDTQRWLERKALHEKYANKPTIVS